MHFGQILHNVDMTCTQWWHPAKLGGAELRCQLNPLELAVLKRAEKTKLKTKLLFCIFVGFWQIMSQMRKFCQIWNKDNVSFQRGNPGTMKMDSTGWQHRLKPVITTAFVAFARYVNMCFWKQLCRLPLPSGRCWFSTRVRTKRRTILTCWTSQETPGYVPLQSGKELISTDCETSGDLVYFSWNNWRRP